MDHFSNNRFDWLERPEGRIFIEQLVKLWAVANTFLLRYIPSNQLLVIETGRLTSGVHQIAEFVGASPAEVSSAHVNQGRGLNYLRCFDRHALERVFDVYSSELMAERFPDITLENFTGHNQGQIVPNRSDILRVFSLARLPDSCLM